MSKIQQNCAVIVDDPCTHDRLLWLSTIATTPVPPSSHRDLSARLRKQITPGQDRLRTSALLPALPTPVPPTTDATVKITESAEEASPAAVIDLLDFDAEAAPESTSVPERQTTADSSGDPWSLLHGVFEATPSPAIAPTPVAALAGTFDALASNGSAQTAIVPPPALTATPPSFPSSTILQSKGIPNAAADDPFLQLASAGPSSVGTFHASFSSPAFLAGPQPQPASATPDWDFSGAGLKPTTVMAPGPTGMATLQPSSSPDLPTTEACASRAASSQPRAKSTRDARVDAMVQLGLDDFLLASARVTAQNPVAMRSRSSLQPSPPLSMRAASRGSSTGAAF